mgnify:CR=1 FL=1
MRGILRKNVSRLLGILLFGAVVLSTGCQKEAEEGFQELTPEKTDESSSFFSSKDSKEENETEKENENENDAAKSSDTSGSRIVVYVCGEVNSPGVYMLDEGSRVCDALRVAGGMTEHAAEAYLNQARSLSDGERVYVPSKEEAEQLETWEEEQRSASGNDGADGKASGSRSGRVSINRAGKEELLTLPGIGETKADAILDYREKHGRFSAVEELMQVEGIKEGTYNKLKDKIEL